MIRIFSEKMRVVDQARNSQNGRFLAKCSAEVPPINSTKHLAGAMMLGIIASEGKVMLPYWFPAGLKVTTEVYVEVLKNMVKPCWTPTSLLGTTPSSKTWHQPTRPRRHRSG